MDPKQVLAFDESELRKRLTQLDPWKRVAFMLLCCSRMIPNYEKFSAETGFGNPEVLKSATTFSWIWLRSGRVGAGLGELKLLVDSQAPDTETPFQSEFTSAALDATSAVGEVIDVVGSFIDADTVEKAVDVAILAQDTVYLYVQNFGYLDIETDEETYRHPLMQNELAQQKADLERRAVIWNRKRFTNRLEGDSRYAEVICHAASFVERSA